jgi:hypothetical protein
VLHILLQGLIAVPFCQDEATSHSNDKPKRGYRPIDESKRKIPAKSDGRPVMQSGFLTESGLLLATRENLERINKERSER